MLSIRVVLVAITLITVLSMGVGLIALSVQAQHSIVSILSTKVQTSIAEQITEQIGNLFDWAETELEIGMLCYLCINVDAEKANLLFLSNTLSARMTFQVTDGLVDFPNGTNPFVAWPTECEDMWSIVRRVSISSDFLLFHSTILLFFFSSYFL
jgi:hypothetical protein